MNNTRKERQLPVARVMPGDYPLLSPESRAAARALLEAREETTINVQVIHIGCSEDDSLPSPTFSGGARIFHIAGSVREDK